MDSGFFLGMVIGILPVAGFLATLLLMDSFKLVRMRTVIMVILAGGCIAGLSYYVNVVLLNWLDLDRLTLVRYIAPLVEEVMKGAVVYALIRTRRVGFLVDAAIFGFAVGAGFAMIENLYYLQTYPDGHVGVWVVRGFGTAIMHGGATAMFAMMGLAMVDRTGRTDVGPFIPGFIVATALHSIYNHFFVSPVLSTIGIILVLPPLMYSVFQESERALRDWLGTGFDTDAELLALLGSGDLPDSPIGSYLHELRDKFHGHVVADLLCYLRIHAELSLRGKGLLMMREAGFAAEPDEHVRSMFAELEYLQGTIGRTGQLAMEPLLRSTHKDLWQLYMLKD